MRSPSLSLRLAVQDLGHRRGRAALLALAVAVGGGAVFTATALRRAIGDGLRQSLDRMGADLMVVPREATVNLTPALLTAEPTDRTFGASTSERLSRLPGVEAAAPQRYFSLPSADKHGDLDLVVFDPARDFTVLPWLAESLDRPIRPGDVIVGARRPESVGGSVPLFNRTFPVYGKLALTGVGPFERSYFVGPETAAEIASAAREATGRPILTSLPDRHSALLIRLAVGTRPDQFRFAAAGIPEIQVVAGNGLITSVRHAIATLLVGAVAFTALTLLTTALMVGVIYTGLLAERRRELGLLLAVGMRPAQVVRLILAESALTTGLGGVCGVILGFGGLLLFRRSLGFLFESHGVPFRLPSAPELAVTGVVGALLCCGAGLLGALLPAWRAARREPYTLVRGEGA